MKGIKIVKSKISSLISKFSLWLQLSIFMLIVVTVVIFELNHENYTVTRNIEIENQISISQNLADLEIENFDSYLTDLAYFCIMPYYDSDFTKLINQNAGITTAEATYIQQQMLSYYYTRSDLNEYEIYLIHQGQSFGRLSGQQHISMLTRPSFDTEKIIGLCGSNDLHQAIVTGDGEYFFDYYHTLISIKDQSPQAIVHLRISQKYFKKIKQDYTLGSVIFILNGDNDLIATSSELISTSEDARQVLASTSDRLGYDETHINGEGYFLVRSSSLKTGMQLISCIPISSIDNQLAHISESTYRRGAFNWLISIVIIYAIILFATRPLGQLSSRMREVGNGNFNVIADISGSKEVASLSESFNFMIEHINSLIHRNYILKISEKNARIEALEAQINPHFLNNTLQAIATEALVHDQPKIYTMITTLASYLRYAIKGKDIVPLKDEMKYLSDYISLQKLRMGDALQYSVHTDDFEAEPLIPKICIQPLVENSIIHGYSRNGGVIHINLSITKGGLDKLTIKVLDDGCGISAEQLNILRHNFERAMSGQNEGGVGLTNLYVRLKLFYGEIADLKIESVENEYTEICLFLPMRTEERENVQMPDN